MSTLTVTITHAALATPTEDDLDNARNSILDYFNGSALAGGSNGPKPDGDNVASGGILWSQIGSAPDDDYFQLGTGIDGKIGFTNSEQFRFRTTASTNIVVKVNGSTAATLNPTTAKITLGGSLALCQSQGTTTYPLYYWLSRYRKPVLVFNDTGSFTVENNTGTSNETLVLMRDRALSVTESTSTGAIRKCSLATTASGYISTDTGNAKSGIRAGLTASGNTWYYVYFVRVRYGSNSSSNYFIMVVDDTSPVQSNVATLDTRYGTGEWVYAGLIRRGYNDGATSTTLVNFRMDGFGRTTFLSSGSTTSGFGGIVLVDEANDADSSYTISIGSTNLAIPVTVSFAEFSGFRTDDGFAMYYRDNVGTNLMSGGVTALDRATGTSIEVPVVSGNVVYLDKIEAGAWQKYICLISITDHYV